MLDKDSKAPALRPAVGYLRRSTDRQDQSLGDQEAALRRHADANGLEILRLYTDDAVSGTSADNRPGFQRLIADASNGHCDFRAILVYDIKRFGRVDNDEAGYYRHLLRKAGVEVVYTSEGFTGHDTDEIVRTVKQLQARQESKDLAKVTLRGQLTSLNAGSYLGGVPPFGYDYLYVDSTGQPIHIVRFNDKGEKLLLHPQTGAQIRLVPQGERLTGSKEDQIRLVPSAPERVALVRRFFEEYLSGMGYSAIASKLNSERTPSPRSREWDAKYNGQWGRSTIKNILSSAVYVGDTTWNRRTQAKFSKVGKMGQVVERSRHDKRLSEPNPKEEWIVTQNTHQPLVSCSTFDAVQEARARRNAGREHVPRPRGRGYYSNFLLSGLIVCADCGHRFMGYTHKSRACTKDPALPRPRYYLCGGYVRKGRSVCRRVAYPHEPFDSYILGRLQARLEVFLRKGGDKVMRKSIREAVAQAGPEPKNTLTQIQAEMSNLKKDVDRLLENLTPTNRDFVDERLQAIRRRLRELDAKEDDLRAQATAKPDPEATVAAALALVGRFCKVLAHGSIVEQKEVLRGFIASISLQPTQHRAVITWHDLPASF